MDVRDLERERIIASTKISVRLRRTWVPKRRGSRDEWKIRVSSDTLESRARGQRVREALSDKTRRSRVSCPISQRYRHHDRENYVSVRMSERGGLESFESRRSLNFFFQITDTVRSLFEYWTICKRLGVTSDRRCKSEIKFFTFKSLILKKSCRSSKKWPTMFSITVDRPSHRLDGVVSLSCELDRFIS